MVQKFYAYYKGKPINAYKGLKLKFDRKISVKKELAEIFDSPNKKIAKPVFPKAGKYLPFYSYYKDSGTTPQTSGEGKNFTIAHVLFKSIFADLKEFTIQQGNNDAISVSVKKCYPEYRVKISENNERIIEILYTLEKTFPYSYYYKWNGCLAVEISRTNRIEKTKVDDLEGKGIQIFEVPVPKDVVEGLNYKEKYLTKNDKSKIMSETEFESLYKKYSYLYTSTNFIAYGKFLGTAEYLTPIWKERYMEMNKYEEQLSQLKSDIEEQQSKCNKMELSIQEKINELTELNNNIKEAEHVLGDIEKLKNDNARLNDLLAQEKQDNQNISMDLKQTKKDLKKCEGYSQELLENKKFSKIKNQIKVIVNKINGN
ncbi:hypothetical protein IGI96_002290 [Enterococcus sp. DIV0421]|uniref:hypothetical protein n=1 Tax=Enterococcus TaxID=1350 RepID=UPI000A339775|nr:MULTISPECIES: hypothetical protein [Enterococcus]OTO01155.1 hypothetical protein A5883_003472 [Enterococcus sp. 5B3_DIV0040]